MPNDKYSHNSLITVKTSYDSNEIHSEVLVEGTGLNLDYALPNKQSIVHQCISLQKKGVRDALIALGWTPPLSEKEK